jgi:putative transposase
MPRLARVVIAGIPHHVTQRGNRRQQTFFSNDDYETYRELMAEWCAACGVTVWAYCLMPNHVHLIAVPERPESLRLAIGEAHRRYTRRVNFREGWRGHLWQGRFASFPMSADHVYHCARYVELNPVRAQLVGQPQEWPYSSARAHLTGSDDVMVRVAPLLEMACEWSRFLQLRPDGNLETLLRQHETTGRPLGDEVFVAEMEARAGRCLRCGTPGRRRSEVDTCAGRVSCSGTPMMTIGNAYGVPSKV